MTSTAVYEMDNIEYFLLPLWQVTYNNWEEQNKARKEYAYVTSLINEADCTFIGDNYIGDKLFFTDYEETQRAKVNNAKPTEMPNDPLNDVAGVDKAPADDFDLDSLL